MDALEAFSQRFEQLLTLAEELRRSNLARLAFDARAWRRAVAEFHPALAWNAEHARGVREILRAGSSVARRLGDAGAARLTSFGVGRDPNSSTNGRRFHADLEAARRVAA